MLLLCRRLKSSVLSARMTLSLAVLGILFLITACSSHKPRESEDPIITILEESDEEQTQQDEEQPQQVEADEYSPPDAVPPQGESVPEISRENDSENPEIAMKPRRPLPHTPPGLPELLLDDMDRNSLQQVIRNQLAIMQEYDWTYEVYLGDRIVTRGQLAETLEAFLRLIDQNLSAREFSRRVKEEFTFYKAGSGRNKKVVFTGYYVPVVQASPVRTDEYKYPLYRIPDDPPDFQFANNSMGSNPNRAFAPEGFWKKYTRKQIDNHGVLENKGLEIAWLKNDLERFFLHIQGSGSLQFPDATTHYVRFAAANNYQYKGIGKLMIRDGVLPSSQGSMQGIKRYFKNHPDDIPRYLYQNKRYIFFTLDQERPVGSGGGELVGGRSIATDKAYYPAGALAFILLKKPVLDDYDRIRGWEKSSRFVVDQDTGNDIRGPGRADLFFGTGYRAGVQAGHFKVPGNVYYLIKKE